METTLLKKFQGSLIGMAAADALGGKFEGQTAEHIRSRVGSLDALLNYPAKSLWYTDDTQMMIGVAETLIQHHKIVEPSLCEAFVHHYMPSRGYGQGARAIIEAMAEGRDYSRIAQQFFPGGSYGNGAAMRIAPVGLLFRDDPDRLWEEAYAASWPTHTHPIGIEGAQMLGLAISMASQWDLIDQKAFVDQLLERVNEPEFRQKLMRAREISHKRDLPRLGNGITAQESVCTAIACFLLHPDSYAETIGAAIFLGGDTDTIAAMAGALSGAYLGIDAIPHPLWDKLESSPVGRDFIMELADKLHQTYSNQFQVS